MNLWWKWILCRRWGEKDCTFSRTSQEGKWISGGGSMFRQTMGVRRGGKTWTGVSITHGQGNRLGKEPQNGHIGFMWTTLLVRRLTQDLKCPPLPRPRRPAWRRCLQWSTALPRWPTTSSSGRRHGTPWSCSTKDQGGVKAHISAAPPCQRWWRGCAHCTHPRPISID